MTDVLLLFAAAVALYLLFMRTRLADASAEGINVSAVNIESWPSLLALGIRNGSSSAPIQVVAFVDYQCPFCRQTHGLLNRLHDRHPSAIAISTVHFPLRQHKQAVAAANAAVCAHRQGKFLAMQSELYRNQEVLPTTSFDAIAGLAGVTNIPAFRSCMLEADTLSPIRLGIEAAMSLRLRGTPSFVVNGSLLTRIPGERALEEHLIDMIARSNDP